MGPCLQGLPEYPWTNPRADAVVYRNPPAPAGEGPLCASLPSSVFIDMFVVHNLLWWEYLYPSKHYESSLPPPCAAAAWNWAPHQHCLGAVALSQKYGQDLVLPEGREWQLAVLPSLPVLRALVSNPPFPLVSPQDVGSLDEKMKNLDVNQDSELKFNEYWRLIGELAKEIRKEKALEIQKK